MKTFSALLALCEGLRRDASDLIRHHAHYDITVMETEERYLYVRSFMLVILRVAQGWLALLSASGHEASKQVIYWNITIT